MQPQDIILNMAHVETFGDASVGIDPYFLTIDFHGLEVSQDEVMDIKEVIKDFVQKLFDDNCRVIRFDHEPEPQHPPMEY